MGVEGMGRTLKNRNDYWFKFYAARWWSSKDVISMSLAERGVYITLITAYYIFPEISGDLQALTKLLQIDRRTLVKWLHKFTDLAKVDPKSKKLLLPKCNQFMDLEMANNQSDYIERKKERIERKEEVGAANLTRARQQEAGAAKGFFDRLRKEQGGPELMDKLGVK